jgi:hypothetical protein
MTRKTFERLWAGVVVGAGDRRLAPDPRSRELTPEIYIKPDPTPERSSDGAVMFPAEVVRAALGRSLRSTFEVEGIIGVRDEAWQVDDGSGSSPGTASSETAAHQHARYRGGIAMSARDTVTAEGL